jgi:hypothetical protein
MTPKADIDRRCLRVRFGSSTDIASRPRQVRFTPKSGHLSGQLERLLRATS